MSEIDQHYLLSGYEEDWESWESLIHSGENCVMTLQHFTKESYML